MKYPKSVSAARSYESSSLALADALAKECKNDKSVAEAHREMIEEGITTLTERRCQQLRVVGLNFAPETRFALHEGVDGKLPAAVFEAAPSAKVLKKIISKTPKGQRITGDYVRAEVRKMAGVPARGQSSERDRIAIEVAASIVSEADGVLAALSRLQDLLTHYEIDQTTTDYVVDRMLTAAKTAREISDDIRKGINQRSHLKVV